MNPHPYLSSYLVAPAGHSRPRRWQRHFPILQQLQHWWQLCPPITGRVVLGLTLWVVLIGGGLYSWQHRSLPEAPVAFGGSGGSAHQVAGSQRVANVIKVAALPTGPTGQLLPPGTLAAPYTYGNSYTRGQCTWYVAGRRQVPNTWGNARTWLPRAKAAGWATGTTPALGAIAWTSAGRFGHVAVVTAIDGNRVQVSEMNFVQSFKIDDRWAPAGSFQYIY